MIQNPLSIAGLALVATMGFATVADAAPISFTETYVKNYGENYGADGVPQYGNLPGLLGADYITVKDTTGVERFFDTISFAGLVYDTIDTITLTLGFADAGSGKLILGFGEKWLAYAPSGFKPDGSLDDDKSTRYTLGTLKGTGEITFNIAADVFNTAVSAERLGFWFGDKGGLSNDFKLKSATLTVAGNVSPVPLPAAGLLLLGALSGLAVVRRRRDMAA